MILKNNEERQKFLDAYEQWPLLGKIPELHLKFYKFTLPTNAVIIATEWMRPGNRYVPEYSSVKYSLILKENHTGQFITGQEASKEYYKYYDLSGISKTLIVDYLRKNKCDIDLETQAI